MPENPISLNLAVIVHRLLTSPRGWRVSDLMDRLRIADRTYRKYRQILQEQFLPWRRDNGTTMVQEIGEGEGRWLRLVELDETGVSSPDFAARIAALNFARQMFGFLQKTEVGMAMAEWVEEFHHSLRDRPFVLGHVLRNVSRLFYVVPDAPKDYSAKKTVIAKLLQALLFSRVIEAGYRSATGGPKTLVLEPLSLLSHRSALYLLARCPAYSDIRVYAVDRLDRLQITADRFEYPTEEVFHPRQYTEGCFGIFHQECANPVAVELVFNAIGWLKVYLKERRWHPSQQFEERSDGRLRMTFEVSSMTEVWPWIRSFGDDVQVIRPEGPVPRSMELV